jgi:hypothetical protein
VETAGAESEIDLQIAARRAAVKPKLNSLNMGDNG